MGWGRPRVSDLGTLEDSTSGCGKRNHRMRKRIKTSSRRPSRIEAEKKHGWAIMSCMGCAGPSPPSYQEKW